MDFLQLYYGMIIMGKKIKVENQKLRGNFYPVSLYLTKKEKEWLGAEGNMNIKVRNWIKKQMKLEKPHNEDWEDDLNHDLEKN